MIRKHLRPYLPLALGFCIGLCSCAAWDALSDADPTNDAQAEAEIRDAATSIGGSVGGPSGVLIANGVVTVLLAGLATWHKLSEAKRHERHSSAHKPA